MTTLWPRLDRPVAELRFAELRGLRIDELAGRADVTHPAQRWASAGGGRATTEELRELRSAVVSVAENFGYPDALLDAFRIPFDRALAPVVRDAMAMAVAEALDRSVWNFTTLVLAPDLTAWRFGVANAERWVCSDRTRHMFSRLWWQASQLTTVTDGVRDASLLDRLSESDLNQLLERTSIGGCRPLVMALARAIVALDDSVRSRDVVREASLRILRVTSVVDPYGLDTGQLDVLVERAVADALTTK